MPDYRTGAGQYGMYRNRISAGYRAHRGQYGHRPAEVARKVDMLEMAEWNL